MLFLPTRMVYYRNRKRNSSSMLTWQICSGPGRSDAPWNMLKSRFNVLAQERPRLGENGLVCVQKEGLTILEEEGILTLRSVLSGGHCIIFII